MGKYRPLGEEFYLYTINERGYCERAPLPEEFWPTEEEKQAILGRKGDLQETGETPPKHKPTDRFSLIPKAIWTLYAYTWAGVYDRVFLTEGQLRYAKRLALPYRYEWELMWDDNSDCIILDAFDVCIALGLNLEEVFGEYIDAIHPEFNKYRARKAKVSDVQLVIDGLEDINCHELCRRLDEAVRAHGQATQTK